MRIDCKFILLHGRIQAFARAIGRLNPADLPQKRLLEAILKKKAPQASLKFP